MKRCKCGKSKLLKHLRDPLLRTSEMVCYPCIRERFPKGAFVVMFQDYREWTYHYIWIRSEADIDELVLVGEWAQRAGLNNVGVYIYHRWHEDKNIGPVAFNMGHPNSLDSIRQTADSLRIRHSMEQVISGVTSSLVQQRLNI